jgi:hypothetical protein
MRIVRLVGLKMICALLLAAQSSPFAVQYGARLKVSSPSELDQRLQAPFTKGIAHPAGVSNCAQLLTPRGRASQTKAPGTEFQEERSTMMDCLALQKLRNAMPARTSYVRDLAWDAHVLPLLPPQLAITVSKETERAANDAASRGRNWVDFDPSATASSDGPDQIEVTGKGFIQRLILWGRGDFNGDGIEDLLVESLDTLTGGSYRSLRLFVLTRRNASAGLSVVSSQFD